MPLAQDARKPIFELKPANGAIGAHSQAVSRCLRDFRVLASTIEGRLAEDTQPRTDSMDTIRA